MEIHQKQDSDDTKVAHDAYDSFRDLYRFDGPLNKYWPMFMETSVNIAGAGVGLLLVRTQQEPDWKSLCVWPAASQKNMKVAKFIRKIEALSDGCVKDGYAWDHFDAVKPDGAGDAIIGVRLNVEETAVFSVAVFIVENKSAADIKEAVSRIRLLSEVPLAYRMRQSVLQARSDVERLTDALDFLDLINREKRFLSAAMQFCNELASRFSCTRVSLGWLEKEYVRMQAISHMEQFEKKMDAVQDLEAAMEEAFDQDEEILLPRPEGSHAVTRDHDVFSKSHGVSHMVSLPIRLDEAPVGVVTCERETAPFTEQEVRALRVLSDQAIPRIGDLKRSDRWFGARLLAGVKDKMSIIFGVKHTFVKSLGLTIALLLAFLLFGKWEYRVEAPFVLKTDDLAYIAAPYEGYIKDVNVRIGDLVGEGDVLLVLDTRELLFEESATIADQLRYKREAEKARAKNALAEMKIAQALENQAKARLDLVRYKLVRASLKAPFSGIVVEGEFKELLGAPVRKGDVLFKTARIEKMYPELEVDERDIHELSDAAVGEVAFVSRPGLKFSFKIERIDPVAVTKETGNVFLVRTVLDGSPEQWWRPGMSGIAKINIGRRNILWIFTHRTVDFLRIWLWW